MPRNGAGTFSLSAGVNPVVTGTTITSNWWNTTGGDIATALTASIANDGQTPILANLPMSTYRHTGVGNAVARTDYSAAGQIQDGGLVYAGTVGGTADVITITLSPVITAYAAGQVFHFIASGANTTNVTLNVNGVGAKAVTKVGAVALIAGDIPSGSVVTVRYDGTQFQLASTAASVGKVTITQPASSSTLTIANGKTLTASNTLTFAGTDGSTLNVGAGGTLGTAAYTAASAYATAGSATASGLTMNTARLLGRTTASSGAIEEITVSGATLSGGALTIQSGALILIATLTPTAAASVDFLSTFTSSYDSYLIIGQGLNNGSGTDNIRMQLATGGVADTGSNYYTNTIAPATTTTAGANMQISSNTINTGIGCDFHAFIHNANSTALKSVISFASSQSNGTPTYSSQSGNHVYSAANTVSGGKLFWNGGANFAAQGKVYIYGIKNS